MDRLKRTKSYATPPSVDTISADLEMLHTHSLQQTGTIEWQDHVILGVFDAVVVACKQEGNGSIFLRHTDELGRWLPTATICLEKSVGLAYPDRLPLFSAPGQYIVAYFPTGHLIAWDYYGHCFYEEKLLWDNKIIVPNAIAVTSTAIVIAFSPEHSHSILVFISTSTWKQHPLGIKGPPGVTSLSVDPANPVALWGSSLWGIFSVNTIIFEFAAPVFALDVLKAFEITPEQSEQISYATAADSYRAALVKFIAGDKTQKDSLLHWISILYTVFNVDSPILRLPSLDKKHWCHHINHTGYAMTMVSDHMAILITLGNTKSITVFPLPPSQYEVLSCCPLKDGILVAYSNCTIHYLSTTESDVVFLKKSESKSRRTVGAPPTGILSSLNNLVLTHGFEDEIFVCQVFT